MLFYGIPPQSSSKLLKIENSFPNSPEFLRKLLCLENSPQISSNLLLLSKKHSLTCHLVVQIFW